MQIRSTILNALATHVCRGAISVLAIGMLATAASAQVAEQHVTGQKKDAHAADTSFDAMQMRGKITMEVDQ